MNLHRAQREQRCMHAVDSDARRFSSISSLRTADRHIHSGNEPDDLSSAQSPLSAWVMPQ